jgi:aspartyl-tRNA synthetase
VNKLSIAVHLRATEPAETTIELLDEGIHSSLTKAISEGTLKHMVNMFNATSGDDIFIVADNGAVCTEALGNLRTKLAVQSGLIPKDVFVPVWIINPVCSVKMQLPANSNFHCL